MATEADCGSCTRTYPQEDIVTVQAVVVADQVRTLHKATLCVACWGDGLQPMLSPVALTLTPPAQEDIDRYN